MKQKARFLRHVSHSTRNKKAIICSAFTVQGFCQVCTLALQKKENCKKTKNKNTCAKQTWHFFLAKCTEVHARQERQTEDERPSRNRSSVQALESSGKGQTSVTVLYSIRRRTTRRWVPRVMCFWSSWPAQRWTVLPLPYHKTQRSTSQSSDWVVKAWPWIGNRQLICLPTHVQPLAKQL